MTVMNGGYDGGVGRGGVGVTSVDARQSTDKLFVRTHEQKKKKTVGVEEKVWDSLKTTTMEKYADIKCHM